MAAEGTSGAGDLQLGPWRLVGTDTRFSPLADQGVTTIPGRRGRRRVLTRGSWSIPLRLRRPWPHIGDPDAGGDLLVDCYQGPAGARTKMYRATVTGTSPRDFVHPLATADDEQMNNSFVALSPDRHWMVSGEWNQMRRFLVFPTPLANPAVTGPNLELAAAIELDRPVRNVQGATFVDPVTLLCSTDDPDTDLWPVARQLLQVDLEQPLDGKPARGTVRCLGALPLRSRCHGTFEVEGIDYDETTGDLRVVIVPPAPCAWVVATIYRFRRH